MIFVVFCSLYVSKIVNFGRCINLLQAKNVKWPRLIWPTLYISMSGQSGTGEIRIKMTSLLH